MFLRAATAGQVQVTIQHVKLLNKISTIHEVLSQDCENRVAGHASWALPHWWIELAWCLSIGTRTWILNKVFLFRLISRSLLLFRRQISADFSTTLIRSGSAGSTRGHPKAISKQQHTYDGSHPSMEPSIPVWQTYGSHPLLQLILHHKDVGLHHRPLGRGTWKLSSW